MDGDGHTKGPPATLPDLVGGGVDDCCLVQKGRVAYVVKA